MSWPDSARQATISWSKYFIVWTSPTPISSDQATWNHPVGFIDNGGLAIRVSSLEVRIRVPSMKMLVETIGSTR